MIQPNALKSRKSLNETRKFKRAWKWKPRDQKEISLIQPLQRSAIQMRNICRYKRWSFNPQNRFWKVTFAKMFTQNTDDVASWRLDFYKAEYLL